MNLTLEQKHNMRKITFEKKQALDGKIESFIDDRKAFENLSFNRRYTQKNRAHFKALSQKYSDIATELINLRLAWK